MTISVQNDAGLEGSGDTINPATVQTVLIQIVTLNGTVNDLGMGQGATTGDLIAITYTQPATNTTAPATRINTLVNTNFNVNPGGPDIVIVGTGPNFTLLDGTVDCGNGFTIAPNTTDNPTKSIYVIFDTSNCNGNGILVRAVPGGPDINPTPNPVVLYHELSHAFRRANGSSQPDDEIPAINDENVLRPLLGIGLRDPQPPHTGTCTGCAGPSGPSCCIIASIATGSAYSENVIALRAVRDGVLRKSDVGFDFFQHLFHDYYGFSPQVCKLMASSPELRERIRLYFVGPLAQCLRLLQRYNFDQIDPDKLGWEFEYGVRASELASLPLEVIDEALALLHMVETPGAAVPSSLAEFGGVLDEGARSSPYVRWALLEPIQIYARSLRLRLRGASPAELGIRLAEEFDNWAVRLPLTEAWKTLSNYALANELAFLKRTLLSKPAPQIEVGRRLAEIYASDSRRLATLQEAGFIPAEG